MLRQIDAGEVTLVLTKMDESFPEYVASNGWAFRVFFDVGDWDYVEEYRRPGEVSWRSAWRPDPPDIKDWTGPSPVGILVTTRLTAHPARM